MSDRRKAYITTIRYSIAVKADGEVVIYQQDMHTGKITILPLIVKDGKVCAAEPPKEAPDA